MNVVKTVADAVAAYDDFVRHNNNINMKTGEQYSCSFDVHIPVYVWVTETDNSKRAVLNRLNKQVGRLKAKGQRVEYIQAHGKRMWWFISTTPLWSPPTGRGRPPAMAGTGTWVPAPVALAWFYHIMASGLVKGYSRSSGWQSLSSAAPAPSRPRLVLGRGGIAYLRLSKQLADNKLHRVRNVTPSNVQVIAMGVDVEARIFLGMPDSAPCAQCDDPIGDVDNRQWSVNGPLCGTCPVSTVTKIMDTVDTSSEADLMAVVLQLGLQPSGVTEAAIECCLYDAGHMAWFATDRDLIEHALHIIGFSCQSDGTWESFREPDETDIASGQ
jgi:hypothetical protein